MVLAITGRVQGVFFRSRAKAAAERRGLVGYARNETDGSVTIVAQGNKEALISLRDLIRQGFNDMNVINIVESWQMAEDEFSSFDVQ